MTTKFTPGPYKFPFYLLGDDPALLAKAKKVGLEPERWTDNDGSVRVVKEDEGPVAIVPLRRDDVKRGETYQAEDEERDANAFLFTASPDLYAALDQLARFCAMRLPEEDVKGEEMQAAAAALAKARGEDR